MKTTRNKSVLLALLAGTFLLGGCATSEKAAYQPAGTEVVVAEAAPLPMTETMTTSPGPGFVWIPGAWSWRGQWVWDRGHWDHPPRTNAVWVAPRCEQRGDHYVFIQGGWTD